jgi:hypothetical protein
MIDVGQRSIGADPERIELYELFGFDDCFGKTPLVHEEKCITDVGAPRIRAQLNCAMEFGFGRLRLHLRKLKI